MKIILLIIGFFVSTLSALGQSDTPSFTNYHKNVYFEVFGGSLVRGLNYDMRLAKGRMDGWGLRAGIGGVSSKFVKEKGLLGLNIISFPIGANYLIGKSRNGLIIEVGGMPIYGSLEPNVGGDAVNAFTFSGGYAMLGYRLQPRNKGFMFQFSWNPILFMNGEYLLEWFGVSFGIGFKQLQ